MITANSDAPFEPYPGPRAFRRSDRDIFFGRNLETADLLAITTGKRLSLFYATSGAGKSSLIQAKLIPLLEERGFEVLPIGRVSGPPPQEAERFENIFIYHLKQRLAPLRAGVEDSFHSSYLGVPLSEFLLRLIPNGRDAEGNARFDFTVTGDNGGDGIALLPEVADSELRPRMLFIDQFEELFTTNVHAWEQREPFFVQLRQAVEDDPLLYVVLVMREDYIAYAEDFIHLVPEIRTARYSMKPMGVQAALEAIELPVRKVRPYATGVAEELVKNFRLVQVQDADGMIRLEEGPYVEPVQLQVVCKQLWDSVRDDAKTQIDSEDLRRVCGQDLSKFITEALIGFYDAKIGEVMVQAAGKVDEARLRRWFGEELITEMGMRDILSEGKEETRGLENGIVRLVEATGLIRRDIWTGGARYELIHDRFIEPIRRSNEMSHRRELQQNPLLARVEAWLQSGRDAAHRDPRLLLTGNELVDTERIVETKQGLVSEELIAFVQASKEAEQKRQMYEARRKADEAEKRKQAAEDEARKERLRADQEAAQKRAFRLATAVAVLMFLVAVYFLSSAIGARTTAETAKIVAETEKANAIVAQATAEAARAETQSLRRTDRAASALKEGNAEEALAFAVFANQFNTGTTPSKSQVVLAQAVYASQTRARHELGVPGLGLAYAASHQLALVGGDEGIVIFWNLESGEVFTTTRRHTGKVWSVAISRDGGHSLSAGDDGRVLYWDVANHTAAPLGGEFGEKVFAVAFLPDGDRALIGGSDSKLHIWDLKANRQIQELTGHDDWVYSIAVSPDGNQAVSGSEDQSMFLWDLKDGVAIRRFGGKDAKEGHHDWVRAVAFSSDGKTALSGSRDAIIRWNLESGEAIGHYPTDGKMIYSLAFSSGDNTRFLSGGAGGATLWDVASELPLHILKGSDRPIRAVAFGDDPWTALTIGLDGALKALDISTGGTTAILGRRPAMPADLQPPQECGMTDETVDYGQIQEDSRVILLRPREVNDDPRFRMPDSDAYVGRPATIVSLADVDLSGCPFVVVEVENVAENSRSLLWRIRDLQPMQVDVVAAAASLISLAAGPDGRFALTGGKDGHLTLWDVALGRPLQTREGHDKPISATAFIDGVTAVTGAEDGSLRLWNLNGISEIDRWPQPGEAPPGSAIVGLVASRNPDGSLKAFAITRDGRYISWSPAQPQRQTRPRQMDLTGSHITAVAFTGSIGQALLGASDGSLHFWDGNSLQTVKDLGPNTPSGDQKKERTCDQGSAQALASRLVARQNQALVACADKVLLIDLRLERSKPDGRDDRTSSKSTRTATVTDKITVNEMGEVHYLSFGDDKTALIGTARGMWRWEFGEKRPQALDVSTEVAMPGRWVALAGEHIVSSGGKGLSLRDMKTGQRLYQAQPGPVFTPADEPGRAIVGLDGGEIVVWDWPTTGDAITRTLTVGLGWTWSALAFAGDNRFITGSYTGTLNVWDATAGKVIASSQVLTQPISTLVTNAKGTVAAVGAGDGVLRLWDFETEQMHELPQSPNSAHHSDAILGLAFDAETERLLSGGRDGRAVLWHYPEGSATELMKLGKPITAVALSRDGDHAWLGLEDGAILVINTRTRQTQRLTGQARAIQSLALSPDDKLALSGSIDGSLVLWDVKERVELARFEHFAPVWHTAFGQDAESNLYALSSDAKNVLRAWRLAPPADQLLTWLRNGGRYVPSLRCNNSEDVDACQAAVDGLPMLEPTPSPTRAVVAGLERKASAGEQRGNVPLGGSETWLLRGSHGQGFSIQAIPDRPAGSVPGEEQEERGKLALKVELQVPDGSPESDPRFVVLDDDGYALTISGDNAVGSGPYTLTLRPPGRLDAGKKVTETLATKDVGIWLFQGQKDQFIRVDLTSSDFDTLLEVYDPNGKLAAGNYVSQGSSSPIEAVLSSDGPYLIVARPLNDGSSGAYQLAITGLESTPITPPQPVEGDFAQPVAWVFAGTAGDLLRIDLEPTNDPTILPSLRLVGPTGEVARADNSGQNHIVLPLAVLHVDGNYGIIPDAQILTGGYRLDLSEPRTLPVRLGDTKVQDLAQGIAWELKGAAGKTITIQLEDAGDDIDPYLTVLREDGKMLAEDDDGGDNLNSKITLTASSNLLIVPTALGGETTGRYRLIVTEGQ